MVALSDVEEERHARGNRARVSDDRVGSPGGSAAAETGNAAAAETGPGAGQVRELHRDDHEYGRWKCGDGQDQRVDLDCARRTGKAHRCLEGEGRGATARSP